MRIPHTFSPGAMTLKDLSYWFSECRPDKTDGTIEMTLEQEIWYRNLLPPEFVIPKEITFRGIPVKIYEE